MCAAVTTACLIICLNSIDGPDICAPIERCTMIIWITKYTYGRMLENQAVSDIILMYSRREEVVKGITAFEYAGCPYCSGKEGSRWSHRGDTGSTAKSRLNGRRRMNILRSSQASPRLLCYTLRCSSVVASEGAHLFEGYEGAEVTSEMCAGWAHSNNGFMLYSTNF